MNSLATRFFYSFLAATSLLLSACSKAPDAPAVRPVMVVQPGESMAANSVYSGEVRALEEPQLAFRIGGKIAQRFVDVGTPVKAGQSLAQLDGTDVNLQSQSSQAALASAQSDLALAKSELERYKTLADQQIVSRSVYDSRVSTYNAAAARVKQAKAASQVSGNQTGYAILRAPSDGVIAQRMAEAGQVVAAGQPIFVLATDSGREIAISVSEQDVAKFQPGLPMMVELWAAPGKIFPAKLREISPSADPLARTFAAKVSFEAVGIKAEVGQSARVYVQDSSANKMALPLSAIYQRDKKAAVWKVEKGANDAYSVRLVPVQIGAYGETSVPVIAGIKPDDWIVSAGVHLLLEGQTVKPVDRDNRLVSAAANTISTKR
jgi:membrane fusion protein, multidrug efflux system